MAKGENSECLNHTGAQSHPGRRLGFQQVWAPVFVINTKIKGDQADGVRCSGCTTGHDSLIVENYYPFIDEQSAVQKG